MLKNLIHLNMPYSMDFILIKKKKLNIIQVIFFDSNYFFKYVINFEKNQFLINKDTNSLIIKINSFNNNQIFDYNLFLKKLLNFNSIFYLKIKFKGKGYKIKYYKKNKIMFFFFWEIPLFNN